MGHTTTAASMKAHTSTLRLTSYMLTLLSTSDIPEAADLVRTVSADPSSVGLDTVERVSGLLSVPPAEFFKEHTA